MDSIRHKGTLLVSCITKYKREIAIVAGLCFSAIILGIGYRAYWRRAQTFAHKDFAAALKIFQAPIQAKADDIVDLEEVVFDTDEAKFRSAQDMFARGYEQHKSSPLAGLFLAYKAECLLELGNHQEAIQNLQKAVNVIPSLELKDMYGIKLSLVELDSRDAALRDAGLARLKSISGNTQSSMRDCALYYLGFFYFSDKKFDDARNYWGQLVVGYGSEKYAESDKMSPWATRAGAQLKLIGYLD